MTPHWRRGLAALLWLHALRGVFAIGLLGPLYRQLARALDAGAFHVSASPGDAALALEVIASTAPRALPGALIALATYALLGPWLQQALLHALSGSTLRAAVSRASALYPAALGLRTAAFFAFGLVAIAAVGALQALLILLPASAPLEGCARAACGALVIAFGLILASVHDLAFAALAQGAGVRSCLRAGVTRCTRRVLASSLLALAAGTALAALAELAGRIPLALPYALGPSVVLVVQQCLLFAALAIRAAWLARALELTVRSAPALALPLSELSPPRP